MPQLGHGPGGALALGLGGPSSFFATFEAGLRGLFLCWLMEAWSHVGQWLKVVFGMISLGLLWFALFFPGCVKILKAKFKRSCWGFEGAFFYSTSFFGYLGMTGRLNGC